MLALAAIACTDDLPTAPKGYSLVSQGRAERGLTVHVGLQREGDTTLVAATGITATPADAATVSSNGDVLLMKAGATTISAKTPDGTTVSLVVNVAVPPLIVFDGRAAGNRDIYRIAIDGGDLTRLTTNIADDLYPTSVGTSVLFTSVRDGNAELYTVGIDGTTERRRTQTLAGENQPSLSPDGKRVAYTSNVSSVSKVWIGSIDLTTASLITAAAPLAAASFGNAFAPEGSPSWAPTSDKLVFLATATPSGGAGLFTAAATAGVTPVLVPGSGTQVVEVEPSWNSDGFLLAYAAVVGGATEIFIRDLRTSAVTQLTHNTVSSGQPTWLLDGRVVFTTFSGANSTISWVDPAQPLVIHPIATTGLSAEHSAPVRP
jgi:WD40 repeat protein